MIGLQPTLFDHHRVYRVCGKNVSFPDRRPAASFTHVCSLYRRNATCSPCDTHTPCHRRCFDNGGHSLARLDTNGPLQHMGVRQLRANTSDCERQSYMSTPTDRVAFTPTVNHNVSMIPNITISKLPIA